MQLINIFLHVQDVRRPRPTQGCRADDDDDDDDDDVHGVVVQYKAQIGQSTFILYTHKYQWLQF